MAVDEIADLRVTVVRALKIIQENWNAIGGKWNAVTIPWGTLKMPGVVPHMFPTIGLVLLLSMEYIDLGKWVAAVVAGAHSGTDLILVLVFFNCTAILCQYLANCVGMVTRKNLAQICSEEYCRLTCVLLGIVAELSMIASDLMMLVSVAQAFNLLFGLNWFTYIFFAFMVAVLLLYFSTLWGFDELEMPCMSILSFVAFYYLIGMLSSQPQDLSVSHDWYSNLDLDSASPVMALLGSNIMPHIFYVYSSIVAQQTRPTNITVGTAINNNLIGILCYSAGIFLVNYVLMGSAAAVFHSATLAKPASYDAFLLMDQILKSPRAPIPFALVFLVSNLTRSFTQNLGRQVILRDLFCIDLPIWVYYIIVKVLAFIPTLYCLYYFDSEGICQLLLFCQVILAILLPASVTPLLRASSSKSIMGAYRSSLCRRIFSWCALLGILAANVIFIMEMLFGNCDWLADLGGNTESGVTIPHIILLLFALITLGLTLYLAVVPLRSGRDGLDIQIQMYNVPKNQTELSKSREKALNETIYEKILQKVIPQNSPESLSDEKLMNSENEVQKNSLNCASNTDFIPEHFHPEEAQSVINVVSTNEDDNVATAKSVKGGVSGDNESEVSCKRNVEVAAVVDPHKDGKKGGTNELLFSSSTLTSEIRGSIMTAGLKDENVSHGCRKVATIGLGRAGRRQLAAILDEFWGHLFDLYGQLTEEARSKRIDILLGLDMKAPSMSMKAEATGNEASQKSSLEAGSHPVRDTISGDYNALMQGKLPRKQSSYVPQRIASSWSADPSLQDAHFHDQCDVRDCQPHKRPDFEIPPGIERVGVARRSERSTSLDQLIFADRLQTTLGQDVFGSSYSTGLQIPAAQSWSSMTEPSSFANALDLCYTKKCQRSTNVSGINDSSGHQSFKDKSDQCDNFSSDSSANKMASKHFNDVLCHLQSPILDSDPVWAKKPLENHFTPRPKAKPNDPIKTFSYAESEAMLLQSFRSSIHKLLNLEGSDWLFAKSGGYDEELIECLAAIERFQQKGASNMNQGQMTDEEGLTNIGSSVRACGDKCIWQCSLVLSFGVWCIHRILDLLLTESRPELWGKYTYVLNRLQGILVPAFLNPRVPVIPCECLYHPGMHGSGFVQRKGGRLGSITTSSIILQTVKDVENAISGRKGRSGTAAGNIAFPKGKENVASVLKRYKRRLSKISSGTNVRALSSPGMAPASCSPNAY